MTFKVKDGLIVGNNSFVNANLDVNANSINVSNSLVVGNSSVNATVNSSFFSGVANAALVAYGGKAESSLNANSSLYSNQANYALIANSALYAFGGKVEESLNANSAVYAVNAQFAYTANVANFLNGKAESALDANTAQYANYATYAGIANAALYSYGGKAEEALNANSATYSVNAQFAYTANVANYLNGKAEQALDANTAQYANYATYAGIANAALYSYGGKAEEALNANSATYAVNAEFAYTANVAKYLDGVAADALHTNSATYAVNAEFAYVANVANYLNGKAESALDANTALYLNGYSSDYYTNATNIVTGTLDEARLPYRMNQDVRTVDDVQFHNLTITGNVFFTGNATLIQTDSISVSDSLIYLNEAITANVTNAVGNGTVVTYTANNKFVSGEVVTISGMNPASFNIYSANNSTINFANATHFTVAKSTTDSFVSGGTASAKAAFNPDVGFVAGLTANGVYQHVGFFRDATDGVFKAFDGLVEEPSGPYIDLASARIADIQANTIYAATAIIGNGSITSSLYSGTANNATYAYGKQEQQLSVALANNSTYAYGKQEQQLSVALANNSTYAYGKQEAQLVVNSANNSTYAYGKQETQLSVANSVYSVSANNATYAYGKQESQLSVANSVFSNFSNGVFGNTVIGTVASANNSTYAYGKQESQLRVANAVFAATANNSLYVFGKQENQLSVSFANNSNNALQANNANYLDGLDSSYFTNASNITTGTLPWNVLPPNSINSTSSVAVSNTWTFQDIIINGGIKVQGSFGNTNQVLASNGTGGLYWKYDQGALYYLDTVANNDFGVIRLRDANNVNNDVVLVGNGTSQVSSNSTHVVINTQDQFVGTVTSVEAGSGLLGGPITDTGSLYVGAGAGISVNQDDVAVNAKDGLVANSSGLWVNTYYFSILSSEVSSNNALYLQYKTWEAPGSIGNTTPNDGKFLNLQANTLWVKTNVLANGYIWVNGTTINSTYFPASANNAYRAFGKFENQLNVNSAAYTVASNNASYLNGYNWDSPPKIGETTANTGKFTYANVSSHVAFGTAAHMIGIGKITVSGTSPANIIEFPTSIYSGGKLIIEVTDTHTNFRHISEMLLSHDNTTVSATEYGVVQTANTVLATFETDILSGNVRILATPVSSNTTTFKVIQNLFLA